ncbi:hypothetical protein F443_04080 [Phytophthora nicotianae P1569]|uniref:Myb/SANT-like domain-containing protein n=1 Tax=Phytophthora nicotianae P1569 TaxID=1317065 RepID=V9FN86_PHYNI|nr:hypothetical protein F443_04080 [Phytophthora nicotianae P1569]
MSSSGPRASWDTAKDAFLIDAMTDQARAGKRSDSDFKKEAWAAVTKDINEKFDLQLTKQQIKSRLQTAWISKGSILLFPKCFLHQDLDGTLSAMWCWFTTMCGTITSW